MNSHPTLDILPVAPCHASEEVVVVGDRSECFVVSGRLGYPSLTPLLLTLGLLEKLCGHFVHHVLGLKLKLLLSLRVATKLFLFGHRS